MAFVTRKRLALSSTAWKSIPWTTVDKTSKDIIFDVMGDVSGILEDFDRASAIRDEAPRNEEYLQLAEQCWRIDITIVWWSENIGPVDYMNGLFERKFQNQTPDDAAVAYIMLHYWTACMLLYATLRLSLGACLGTEGLLCLPERADPRTYCRNIIYATEVLRHPMAGAFGIHASMFPFSMAAAYLLAVEGRRDEHDKVSPEMTKLLSLFEDGKAGQKWMGLIQTMFRNSVGAPPPPPGKRESAKGSDIRQMIIYARLWYGLDRGHGLETLFEKCLC